MRDGVLSSPGGAGPGRPEGSMPGVRRVLPGEPRRQEEDQLPARPARALISGRRAAATCWSGLATGEGVRIGLLGDPGSGKTWAARALIDEYLSRSRGIVAVADSKGEGGEWFVGGDPGVFRDVAELGARAVADRRIVFTPDPFGEPLSLESVARWQWSVARRRCRSLVVYDEISDGCEDGEFLDGQAMRRAFTHGRRVGISVVWGAQYAQLVPRAAWECSSHVLVWRQAGNALAILKRRGYLEGGVERVILGLPGDLPPPRERGAFVLLRRGRPWDGAVYRF